MKQISSATDTLFAFYDLSISPVTFDIFNFLLCAEMSRQARGFERLHIVFVPGENDGFMKGFLYGEENKKWRFQNIILPACFLIPSCQTYTICPTRKDAADIEQGLGKNIFPIDYRTDIPVDSYLGADLVAMLACGHTLPTIQPSPEAIGYAKQWVEANTQDKPLILITLRNASYGTAKNSNTEAWAKFANKVKDDGKFFPVIIPDTETVFQKIPAELEGLTLLPEAAMNINFRSAIYECAHLNLLVGCGPFDLCKFNSNVNYLIFKIVQPKWHDATEDAIHGNFGIEEGGQFHFARIQQRLVWQDDDFDTICGEFDKMIPLIDGRESESPVYHDDMEAPIDIANRLHNSGRWRQAREIYKHLLNDNAEDSEILRKYENTDSLYKIGVFENIRRNYPAAIKWLGKAIEINSSKAEYFAALGSAEAALGSYESAIKSVSSALQLNSSLVDAHLIKAISYEALGELDLGISACQEAIKLTPGFAQGYEIQAGILRKKGQDSEAIELLMKAQSLRSPKS